MAVIVPTCLCPSDSPMVAQAKINNNLVALFFLMSAGQFRGNTVNYGSCLCSPLQILASINNNIAGFFTWFSGNTSSTLKAGIETLSNGDTQKAVVFSAGFTTAPSVVAMIFAPDGTGYAITVAGDSSVLSATGFTAFFAGAIPAAGYKMMWIATPTA